MIKAGSIPRHLILEDDIAFYIGYEDEDKEGLDQDSQGTEEQHLEGDNRGGKN